MIRPILSLNFEYTQVYFSLMKNICLVIGNITLNTSLFEKERFGTCFDIDSYFDLPLNIFLNLKIFKNEMPILNFQYILIY